MSLRLLLPIILPGCVMLCSSGPQSTSAFRKTYREVFDFSAERLSNNRVLVTWHCRGETQPVKFEVLRKMSLHSEYKSIGIARPASDSLAVSIEDYRYVDMENSGTGTTYYSLKKTRADGVIFFSLAQAVPGARK